MGIVRDSFVIFKNWTDAINVLPEEYQLETYKAVVSYGITGKIPQNLSPITNALLISFSKGMENSILRYNASVQNGKKGGAPIGNKNAKKKTKNEDILKEKQPKNNLEQPKTSKNNLNVNVNDNVNIKLVNKFKNEYQEMCGRVRERTMKEREIYLKFYEEYFHELITDPWKSLGYEIVDTMIEASEQARDDGIKFDHRVIRTSELAQVFVKVDTDKFRSIVTQLKWNEEIKNRPYYILGCIFTAASDKKNKMTEAQMNKFIKDYEIENLS